jgi:hypothetical protein
MALPFRVETWTDTGLLAGGAASMDTTKVAVAPVPSDTETSLTLRFGTACAAAHVSNRLPDIERARPRAMRFAFLI